MNKEAVTALVGWIIGFIITIILFIIAWNWLFAEPVNTSGGSISKKQSSAVTDTADGNGSAHPVWGKYTDIELTSFKATYKDLPDRARSIANAKGILKETTRNAFLDSAKRDAKLQKCFEDLFLLNKIYYSSNETSLAGTVLKQYPELKNCKLCAGKLFIPCEKCKNPQQKKRVTLRSRSLVASSETKSDCRQCKNTGILLCPDSKKMIRQFIQDTAGRIVPYCKEQLDEVEKEINRRKAAR